MTAPASRVSGVQRTLLAGAIDYAGLFPPAALSMGDAARNYLEYAAGPESWALGRFVVPVARFAELDETAPAFAALAPHVEWKLSVLAGGPPAADRSLLDAASTKAKFRMRIDAVEAKGTLLEGISALAPLCSPSWTLYVEIPFGSGIERHVEAVRALGACVKLRTGGVTADAFPSADALANALEACAAAGVPFKATAGLHHPLRGSYPLTYAIDADRGLMFGYLNVLAAAVLVRRRAPHADVVAMLEEKDANAFRAKDGGLVWRDQSLSADDIHAVRTTQYHGFGSCSFREPLDELRSLAVAGGAE